MGTGKIDDDPKDLKQSDQYNQPKNEQTGEKQGDLKVQIANHFAQNLALEIYQR